MATNSEKWQLFRDSIALTVYETFSSFRRWLMQFPNWEQTALTYILISAIPAILITGFISFLGYNYNYQRVIAIAHPSARFAQPPQLGQAKMIINATGTATVIVPLKNLNLDLTARTLPLLVTIKDSAGVAIGSGRIDSFLLPAESKTVVFSRINLSGSAQSATVSVGDIDWVKPLSDNAINLKSSEVNLTESINPLSVIADGVITNPAAVQIRRVIITVILYGRSGEIVAAATREENAITPFSRRAYSLSWPGLYRADISRAVVQVETNPVEEGNITTPASDADAPVRSESSLPF